MSEVGQEKPAILIIDDEDQIRTLLTRLLSTKNECVAVESAERALSLLDEQRFDLVISDINMSGISGLQLVPLVLKKSADTVVLMVSGQQTIDSAIEAMRVGAFDYITKPLNIDHIEAAVRRALSHRRLLEEKRQYETHLEEMVRERTAELEYLAYHDRLTGLPNRTLFVDRCNSAIANATANGHLAAVALVSLDRFKNINDTLGHAAGDELLKHVATRLQSAIDHADAVARFEGAEFGVLLSNITGPGELDNICTSIHQAFKRSFAVANQEVYITASIGTSLSSDTRNGACTVLQNAGAALQHARAGGGNTHRFYNRDMNAFALKRLSLEASLRHALDNGEFITFYQPVVDVSSNGIVGTEALVRWQHPELGLLAPSEFLDLAESTGLVVDISERVMFDACRQTRLWQAKGCKNLRAAVNVSARHFRQKDFVNRILRIVTDSGLSTESVELELTESSIMENPDAAAEILREIRRLGCKVAIDDFGTGYSSLGYLKWFAVDTLKIDRSFVQGAAANPHDSALVKAMISLAHELGLRVIAEGIETRAQLTFLDKLGCDEAQGYFFSKPTARDMLERLLFPITSVPHAPLSSAASSSVVSAMRKPPKRLKKSDPVSNRFSQPHKSLEN